MVLRRRDFLKAGSMTAFGFGLNLFGGDAWMNRVLASSTDDTKLVFIFQRGGNDAVNTVIPYGDPEYNTANRPTLFIPRANALDLGNEFAGLHPRMAPMMDLYHRSDLTGQAGPGNLAIVHRIGYAEQSQSHFNSQQYWETGRPRDKAFKEGMLYRQVVTTMDPAQNRLAAAALSGSQMTALKGPLPIPTINNPETFTFSGSPTKVRKLIGQLPTTEGGPDGAGLLGAYGGPHDVLGRTHRDLVYGTGLALADAINIVRDAVAQGPYEPSNGAVYPDGSFGNRLSQMAMLLKRTPARVLGLNIGGWDTHTNEGQANGRHGNLLAQVAQGFQALYHDLQEQWDRLIVITMSEFGRTSKENGSRGTDHGHAGAMFIAGGRVQGGIYNCDAASWAEGDLFSARDRYVDRRTDFRAVFAEIFTRHFGTDETTLEAVIPGYTQASLDHPGDFEMLNFLPIA